MTRPTSAIREPLTWLMATAFLAGFALFGPFFGGSLLSGSNDRANPDRSRAEAGLSGLAGGAVLAADVPGGGSSSVTPLSGGELQSCRRSATDLGEWLSSVSSEGKPVPFASNVEMVTVEDEPTWDVWHDFSNVIVVGPEVVRFRGETLGKVGKVDSWNRELRRRLKTRRRVAHWDALDDRVVAMVDRRTRWKTIRAVAKATRKAGYKKLHFLVAATSRVSQPSPSSIRGALDPIWNDDVTLSSSRSTGQLAARVFAECPQSQAVMREHRDVVAREKWQSIARDLPAALVACGCEVEMAAVRDLFWTYLGRYEGTLTRAVTVELSREFEKGSRISKSTRWDKAFRKLRKRSLLTASRASSRDERRN